MSASKAIANCKQLLQQAVSETFREPSRGLTEDSRSAHDIERRILALHADGLKPRDISSLLGVHPMIVLRTLGDTVSEVQP